MPTDLEQLKKAEQILSLFRSLDDDYKRHILILIQSDQALKDEITIHG